MSHVFHRNLATDYPIAVGGDGVYLIDRGGRRFLDASGGAAVSCLGHSHPRVIAAMHSQIDRLSYAHSGFFTTQPMEELADHLIARAPAGIARAYFVSGGSEAVEAAMKMARQYFLEIDQPQRVRFLARRQSYHGNTLGALAVGGNMWRRQQFDPLLIAADHLTACYPYREMLDGETEDAFIARLVAELEGYLTSIDPQTVIAFIAEPVVGATMGAVPAVDGYFKAIKNVLDRHGILMILDEVMCGMGRTGTLFACEQDGVTPDLIAVAKGLGAGYQPIGAALASRRVVDAIRAGSGFFQHGHTYMGHALACAASLAVQQTIDEQDLLSNVRAMGELLRDALDKRFGDDRHIGDIRGRGLFIGLELVADRATKRPFDPSLKIHAKIKRNAMARGLMCYPMGGTIDGKAGDHVLLAPPFIIDQSHVLDIVDRLAAAVDDTVGQEISSAA